jgi:hypothetical protein
MPAYQAEPLILPKAYALFSLFFGSCLFCYS